MPRPRKCRRVCSMPEYQEFGPVNHMTDETITLSIDEFETIRLIDKFELSQAECSTYMSVARTTVQQMYTSARKKIALALVDGKQLKIEGGDYIIDDSGFKGCCYRKEGPCKGQHQCQKDGE